MAIVKMNKFTLVTFESHKKELLRKLQGFSKVEFINLQDEEKLEKNEVLKELSKDEVDSNNSEYEENLSKANSGKNNPMYGKSIMDIMSDDQIIEWKRKVSERAHALWQDEEYRKKVLS